MRVDGGLSLPLAGALFQAGVRNFGNTRYVGSVTALDNVYQGSSASCGRRSRCVVALVG